MTTTAPAGSRPDRRRSTGSRTGGLPALAGAFVSAGILLVVLVVLPVLLRDVGGSPLAGWDLGALGHAARGRQTDVQPVVHLLGRLAVALAWVAWAWLTLCVVLEIRARFVGAPPVVLPGGRTCQAAAAVLVGAVLAVSATGRHLPAVSPGVEGRPPAVGPVLRVRPGSPTPAPADDHLLPAGLAVLEDDRWGGGEPRESPVPPLPEDSYPRPPAERLQTPAERLQTPAERLQTPAVGPSVPRAPDSHLHVVGERETLWSIASDRLGDARRWRELADLNYGRPQTGGGALGRDHWIRAGWVLRLDGLPGPAGTVDPFGTGQHTADPVDGDGADLGSHGVVARREADPLGPGPRGGRHTPPVMPLGAGVLGSGVTTLLERMRRVQQRHRTSGGFIALPGPTAQEVERRARVEAAAGIVPDVERALRLVAAWPGSSWPGSRVVAVRVGPHFLDVVLDRPPGERPPPEPFDVIAGGILRASRQELRTVCGRGPEPTARIGTAGVRSREDMHPVPTLDTDVAPTAAAVLVTAGRTIDGVVLVDLEALGAVVLTGPPGVVDDATRALVVELATSVWADDVDLVLTGVDPRLGRLPGVRVVPVDDDGPSSLLDRLWERRIDGERRLRALGAASFAQARGRDAAGVPRSDGHRDSYAWRPVVVVCGPATDPSTVEELMTLADAVGRHGIVVVSVRVSSGGGTVVPTGAPGGVVVPLGPGTALEMPPGRGISDGASPALRLLGSVVAPQLLGADDLAAVGQALEVAADLRSVPRTAAPYRTMTVAVPGAVDGEMAPPGDRDAAAGTGGAVDIAASPTAPAAPAGRAAPAAPAGRAGAVTEVAVRVLGPVDVVGIERPFTRAGALELVVYLAMHPEGASTDQWATALWPDRLMAPSSLHSTISVARRALGVSPSTGDDHLPRGHGRLTLAPTVGTDWMRFVELADRGESVDPVLLREALTLVRGRPFEGLRSSDWTVLEGIGPAMEAAIVDVSGRLAGTCLASGDAAGATWAARRGLVASPYDERLYRMLLRAADLAGNPAGVEAVMVELVQLVADEVEPLDSVHPATLQLYRSLSRRNRLSLPRRPT